VGFRPNIFITNFGGLEMSFKGPICDGHASATFYDQNQAQNV
jgi:hypothetical protein